MFSTLLGALPRDPARDEATDEERIRGTIADLLEVGLELVSEGESLDPGSPPDPDAVVEQWRRANAIAVGSGGSATVKQVLPGPYSASRDGAIAPEAWADALKETIAALAAAGCVFVEIDEADALAISVVASERGRFVSAHRRMTDGLAGVHLSLTLTGGNLDAAGPSTFFDLPYASYAFDLIAGPDNWRLIAAAPGDRGVICGAMPAGPDPDLTREPLVWAAHYAASTNGRGIARVGLANASSLAGLTRPDALRRLRIVATAARMAVADPKELARMLDPRAIGLPPRRREGASGRQDRPSGRRTNARRRDSAPGR